jgi:hypothetical protein
LALGRGKHCDVVISDSHVSRQQVALHFDGTRCLTFTREVGRSLPRSPRGTSPSTVSFRQACVNGLAPPSTVFGPFDWTRRDTVARRVVAAEAVEELRGPIEQWRLTRTRQGQMPQELWEAAVSAAQRYGVSQVARALGVGHAGLKARTLAASQLSRQARKAAKAEGVVEVHPLGDAVVLHSRQTRQRQCAARSIAVRPLHGLVCRWRAGVCWRAGSGVGALPQPRLQQTAQAPVICASFQRCHTRTRR